MRTLLESRVLCVFKVLRDESQVTEESLAEHTNIHTAIATLLALCAP